MDGGHCIRLATLANVVTRSTSSFSGAVADGVGGASCMRQRWAHSGVSTLAASCRDSTVVEALVMARKVIVLVDSPDFGSDSHF